MELLEFLNLNNLHNLDLISKGGPVMFILLGFSIFAFAIIFIKIIQFLSAALTKTNKIEEVLSKLNGSNAKKLLSEIQNIKSPLARIIEIVIVTKRDKRFDKESKDCI